ncbi:MAG: hypothetical protein H7646_03525, partial [Candidatus Heimdallarchaeota archaeon]|nr:hypothetical protein [Candidatus Heimdallarchaeota archaeon]
MSLARNFCGAYNINTLLDSRQAGITTKPVILRLSPKRKKELKEEKKLIVR